MSDTTEDITELVALREDFGELAAALHNGLSAASIEQLAEAGSLLASLIKTAGAVQDDIKILLRNEAVKALSGQPGAIVFEGESPETSVTVTIPRPRVVLSKDADMGLVQSILGSSFDLYFETIVTHKPRPTSPKLIVSLGNGAPKTILLSTVEEKEGTPRVSFKAVK